MLESLGTDNDDRMDPCGDSLMGRMASKAGAYINPKIVLGTSPSCGAQGVLTSEPLDPGELIFSMPSSLHLSPSRCQVLFPHVFESAVAAIEALPSVSDKRVTDAAQAACIASLMANVKNGTTVVRSESFVDGPRDEVDDGFANITQELWKMYAENLLAICFDSHWCSLATHQPDRLRMLLEPSFEYDYARAMADSMLEDFRRISERGDAHSKPIDFDVECFLRARMCMQSRSFTTKFGSALVPLLDMLNHSLDPSAQQIWSEDKTALIVVTRRAHTAGEELCISYGSFSNPQLMRQFTFTVAPVIENAWTCMCSPSDLKRASFTCASVAETGACLSGRAGKRRTQQRLATFISKGFCLDTRIDEEVLRELLEAAFFEGLDPGSFLRQLCVSKIGLYEEDTMLQAPLLALHEVRTVDNSCAAWWRKVPAAPTRVDTESFVHVKMSEYLCLATHLQATEWVWSGASDSECFADGAHIRKILRSILQPN